MIRFAAVSCSIVCRACTTPAGVCWMHPSAAPGTPCQCFASAGWVAGVVREWVWDTPPSR